MRVPPRTRGSLDARQSPMAARAWLPLQNLLHVTTISSGVLLAATVLALIWANSPWKESYHALWHTEIGLTLGAFHVSHSLHAWINDGLMTVFFLVATLEVKRALLHGELSDRWRAALPLAAALGGMIAPAVIFVILNLGGPAVHGWGVPIATDIAFALGVLALLGNRLPTELRTFLLTLAIVDDIGSILVIAAFYTAGVSFGALAAAAVILGIIFLMQRAGIQNMWLYVAVSIPFWFAMLQSGLHATLAGVIIAAITPSRPYYTAATFAQAAQARLDSFKRALSAHDHDAAEAELGRMEELTFGTEPPLERLERNLTPWSSYVVIPVFALANAGITITGPLIGDALASTAVHGIILGLVIGKPLGITLLVLLATRLGIAVLPPRLTWQHILGAGMVAGIGFTVSLFITQLAFTGALVDEAKVGVLAASACAGTLGLTFLVLYARFSRPAGGVKATDAPALSH